MPTFNLDRFRDLAFGRAAAPDHPLRDEAQARRTLALLPDDDPEYALAELTHWTATMNGTDAFTPGRRGRVLTLMHEAALPLWRALGQRYLAPAGTPTEGTDGNPQLLRAMADSASEFANGFALALDGGESGTSKWVEQNYAALMIRVLRWLNRRLALAYMLQGAQVAAIWERLHYRYADAVRHDVLRVVLRPREDARYNTSPLIEYARPLLLELALPDALRPRQIELAYRIAAWTASSARLEDEPSDEANFAVVPRRDERPTLAKLVERKGVAPIYIATANCLPKLRAALERDAGKDPGEEDVVYGKGFTVRERQAMVKRLLDCWGMDPPRRRTRRVSMAAAARVIASFEQVLGVFPALAKAEAAAASASRRALALKLDDTSTTLQRSKLRAARVGPARVVDASAGGLGLAIRRADAPWAVHGELLAVLVEPGNEWFLGTLRRIFSIENELRLGVQVLAAKPQVLTLSLDEPPRESVWDEALRREATFHERYRRGLLLEPQPLPLRGGEILLAPGAASAGTRFAVSLPSGEQRLRVTRIAEENKYFQRALFESLGAV